MIWKRSAEKDKQDEKVPVKKTKEMPADVSYTLLLSYGVGHVFNDLCASMWFTYLLIFFLYVLNFTDTLAGAALFIGQVADGISTPIVGIFSDKGADFCLCKYGRRKSWHLIGTICVLFSFPFIFSPCYGCQNFTHFHQLLYYSIFIILFQFGWASTQISHLSLVPDLTTNQHARTSLLATRYTFTVCSNIIVYLITWFVFHSWNDDKGSVIGPQDKYKFQLVAYIVIGIGIVSSAIFHIGVKETITNEDDNQQLVESENSRAALLLCSKMYRVACIYMATRLFVNLGQIYIPLYLQSYLNLPSENLAILPLVMYISSFITSITIKPLNMEFGRKFAYIYGTIIGLGACYWIKAGSDYYYRTYEIYGVVIAFGCASSIMLVTSLGITADLIGTDTNNGAFIYGLMSFCDKISNGAAVMVIQYLKCVTGCPMYYRDILLISCGLAASLGLITIFTIPSETRATEPFIENENVNESSSVGSYRSTDGRKVIDIPDAENSNESQVVPDNGSHV